LTGAGPTDLRKHYRTVKTVLRRRDLCDPYFVGKFAFSPYHACAHGCLYCDGRAERYFVEGEFDHDIVIRSNAPALLDLELGKQRERGIVFIGSGVSDSYQPPEREEELMRSCARVLGEHSMAASVLTKSGLVLRDLDLWEEVNRRAGFLLMMSIQTLDESIRRMFEPACSPIEERLSVLAAFKARGCTVGVAAMPFLPYISDSDADLNALAERLAAAGVDFALFGGLTLRPGCQKDFFLRGLSASFPDLVERYGALYGENRPSGAPLVSYSRDLNRRAAAAFHRVSLPTLVPHRIYRDRLPLYDEIYVLLQQMSVLYTGRTREVERLNASLACYRAWLLERKKIFNRRRKQRSIDLEYALIDLARSQDWPRFLGNEKLAAFLREVVIDRRVFDPLTLRLV
jgi:DNA repair photolyase